MGCLQAIERLGWRVTEVSGSSIGAMVAALTAAGYTAAEIQQIGTTLRRRQFLRYNWPEARALANFFRPRAHRKPAGIWSLEPYYRTVSRLLRRARFRDLKLPCFIQATDLTNLRPVVFSREFDPFMEVAFAVKASSAYPGLMAPVEWGGLALADGGAFVDLAALPIRARRIIVSNSRPTATSGTPSPRSRASSAPTSGSGSAPPCRRRLSGARPSPSSPTRPPSSGSSRSGGPGPRSPGGSLPRRAAPPSPS